MTGAGAMADAGSSAGSSAGPGAGTAPLTAQDEADRLRWQCRRGMLELDLLLNRFLDQGFTDLPTTERIAFVRLLGYPDQILHDWLLGGAVPADPAIADLIRRILAANTPVPSSATA